MRLDPDLVRELLLLIEQAPANHSPGNIAIPERSDDEILEHLDLMREAGLVEARALKSGMGGARLIDVRVERITWAGHDFLNNARSDTQWKRAKEIIVAKGGTMSFEILKAVLVQVAKATFHLPTN